MPVCDHTVRTNIAKFIPPACLQAGVISIIKNADCFKGGHGLFLYLKTCMLCMSGSKRPTITLVFSDGGDDAACDGRGEKQ